MIAMRLGLCFLLLSSAAAQQKLTVTSTKPTIAGPKLPLIDYNACPVRMPTFLSGNLFKKTRYTPHGGQIALLSVH
jgi:hypothetical protein